MSPRMIKMANGEGIADRRAPSLVWIKVFAAMGVPLIGVISTWAVLNYRVSAQEVKVADTATLAAKHDTEIAVVKNDISYIKIEVAKVSQEQQQQTVLLREVLRELKQ